MNKNQCNMNMGKPVEFWHLRVGEGVPVTVLVLESNTPMSRKRGVDCRFSRLIDVMVPCDYFNYQRKVRSSAESKV